MYTTFNADEKIKIRVFNHRQLIENLYKFDKNITSYTFKSEIFNFNIKKTNSEETKKKRKTKTHQKKLLDTNVTTEKTNYENEFKIEVEELKECMENFIPTIINQQQIFKQPVVKDTEFDLGIIVHESISFPKLKGENTSENLIKITINRQEYIIPPLCKFYNYNIKDINEILLELHDNKFDLVILDPPWRNKYIRRLKKSKMKSAAYEMLNNDCIKNIPMSKFVNLNSLVVIWCTNSYQHQNAILTSFLPAWNLKLVTKLYWVKMDVNGRQTICNFNSEFGKKQPFETIFIACPENSQNNFNELLTIKKYILMSVPSLINSHKPPLIEILREYLPTTKPNCLEIFARYLQPNFTSIGLEVLKLMDSRLYINSNDSDKV